MNDALQQFARNEIKAGLAKCTPENHRIFKLMYGRNGGKRSVEDTQAMPLNNVVDEIPAEKLDWAMQQISRTVQNNESEAIAKSQKGGV